MIIMTSDHLSSQRGKLLLKVLQLPEVLHDVVHGPAVGELLLELDGLPRRLDVHEHVQEGGHDLQAVRMLWARMQRIVIQGVPKLVLELSRKVILS